MSNTALKYLVMYLIAISPQIAVGTIDSSVVADQVQRVNEFTDRRHTNLLFKNRQALTRGVNDSFVNVRTGNLTFARKDLVVVDRIPIVVSRVYDSSNLETGDFGKGWFLGLAESIRVNGNLLTHRNSSASEIELTLRGGKLEYSPSSASIKDLSIRAQQISLVYKNGFRKIFEQVQQGEGNVYRLKQVLDNNGNKLVIEYAADKIVSIASENGHVVSIFRNSRGLIEQVEASSGGRVRYTYSDDSKLDEFTDANEGLWTFQYNVFGLLRSSLTPEGRTRGEVLYDRMNRVISSSLAGSGSKFEYSPGKTTVKRGKTRRVYVQRADGITTKVVNEAGIASSIEFDRNGLVTSIVDSKMTLAKLEYNEARQLIKVDGNRRAKMPSYRLQYREDGSLSSFATFDDAVLTRRLLYDARGRLVTIEDPNGRTSYTYSPDGDILEKTTPTSHHFFQYTKEGQIRSIRQGEWSLTMQYGPSGKPTSIKFPNGTTSSYSYDGLGLRNTILNSLNGAARYQFNSEGSLVSSNVVSGNLPEGGEQIILNNRGLVDEIVHLHGGTTTIEYDKRGNPLSIVETLSNGSKDYYQYEYDDLERLRVIKLPDGEAIEFDYERGEPDVRKLSDGRLQQITGRWSYGHGVFGSLNEIILNRTNIAEYAGVEFREELGDFVPTGVPTEAGVMFESALTRARVDDISSLATAEGRVEFEQVSNALFLPAEYASTNCCFPTYCMVCIFGCWPYPLSHPFCQGCVPPPPPWMGTVYTHVYDQTGPTVFTSERDKGLVSSLVWIPPAVIVSGSSVELTLTLGGILTLGCSLGSIYQIDTICSVIIDIIEEVMDEAEISESEMDQAIAAGEAVATANNLNNCIVIGESFDRVLVEGASLGCQTIDMGTYTFNEPLSDPQELISIAYMQGWITRAKLLQYTIYDLGRDSRVAGPTKPFYRAERISVGSYPRQEIADQYTAGWDVD